MKGGPYWHVIRFLDHPLLPANAERDVPKIIKHGIDDDGPMHPKSPHVSAPDGIATLFYKMNREEWLKRFLDVEGTENFMFRVESKPWQDLYVERRGRYAEMGFYAEREGGDVPGPGILYHVEEFGNWKPISTCDLYDWGGSEMWIRAQGEAFAKAIWYHKRWSRGKVKTIQWTGISDKEREENQIWCEEFAKQKEKLKGSNDDAEDGNTAEISFEREMKRVRELMAAKRFECRGGCGEKKATLVCSQCKETYYCGAACQKDDWKYHKSVCGVDPDD